MEEYTVVFYVRGRVFVNVNADSPEEAAVLGREKFENSEDINLGELEYVDDWIDHIEGKDGVIY